MIFTTGQVLTAAQLNGVTGFNYIEPSGGDDTTALQTAFNTSATFPVFLKVGVYSVSSPLTIPDGGIVIAPNNHAYQYYDGGTTYNTASLLYPQNGISWTAGSAVVIVGKFCFVDGLAVKGFHTRGDWQVNGFSLVNSQYSQLHHCEGYFCENAFVLGASTSAGSIGVELNWCRASQPRQWGITTAISGGGFLTDGKLINTSTDGCPAGGVNFVGASSWQLIGCRIEQSGGVAIQLGNSCEVMTVVGCTITANAGGSVAFLGNNSYNIINGNNISDNNIHFVFSGGANTFNMIGPNVHTGTTKIVSAATGTTFGGAIAEFQAYSDYNPSGNFYDNSTTQTILSPFVRT